MTTTSESALLPGTSIPTDAARMRALASCPRIVMHGSAGVHAREGGRLYPDSAGLVHFGANLMAPGTNDASVQWGRFAIVAIADDMIDVEGGMVPTTPVGTSEGDDAERFRALMRLPRIRVMQIFGGGPERNRPVADAANPGAFSFSAEFWSTGDPSVQCEPTLGRACLLVLADDLIALQASGVPASEPVITPTAAATEEPHGMEQIVRVCETITERASQASLSLLDDLHKQSNTVKSYVKLSIALSTMPLPALRALKTAQGALNLALSDRAAAIVSKARELIGALPDDRRSRSTLGAVSSRSDLLAAIAAGERTVDWHVLALEQSFEVLLDGGLVDDIGAKTIGAVDDELVIDGIGRWPLDDIVATSSEDGFAFLLVNGQLVEIQQAV